MRNLGDDIVSLFEGAQSSVLIVAPFMRSEALSRLLEIIPAGTETRVITRWRIADLLAGASDLGVYELAEENGVPLYLRHDLHAKLFAADDSCLIGSANVTNAALGWREHANLELLVPAARAANAIIDFEKRLFARAVRATAGQRDRLAVLLERLQVLKVPILEAEDDTFGSLPADWVPQARNPEELYSVYRGDADISRSALMIMQKELLEIGTVSGLDEDGFRAWVAVKISQTPLVGLVVQRIEEQGEVTESEIKELFAELGVDANAYQPRDVLEVLERWLTCFLSMRYETARDSVKLIKARKL